MRRRASLVTILGLCLLSLPGPARAASRAITVDNVDTLHRVDTYDLGADPIYTVYGIDDRSLYPMLFFTPQDRARVERLDLRTGRVRWAIDLRCAQGPPVVTPRAVLYADHQCSAFDRPRITAARPSSGKTLWTASAEGALATRSVVVLYTLQELATGGFDSTIWGVRASTGERLWTYRNANPDDGFVVPKFATSQAVYVWDDYDVVALDPWTGSLLWRLEAPAQRQGIWDADELGVYVYRAPGDHEWLQALDGRTGDLRWQVADPTGLSVLDGTAYLNTLSQLQARSPEGGELRWKNGEGSVFDAFNGVAWTVGYDGDPYLVALDASTGERLAVYPSSYRDIYGTIPTQERVLVETDDGRLRVYEPDR
jgi:outer membrane protein assembly factor BamB